MAIFLWHSKKSGILFDKKNGFQVTCGNKTFSAHRGTLASRSDVFFTAFGSSFTEARTATYNIKNSSPEAVEAMLYYMYTGHLKVKQETWFRLNQVMFFLGKSWESPLIPLAPLNLVGVFI